MDYGDVQKVPLSALRLLPLMISCILQRLRSARSVNRFHHYHWILRLRSAFEMNFKSDEPLIVFKFFYCPFNILQDIKVLIYF